MVLVGLRRSNGCPAQKDVQRYVSNLAQRVFADIDAGFRQRGCALFLRIVARLSSTIRQIHQTIKEFIVPFFESPVLTGVTETLAGPAVRATVDCPADGFKSLTMRQTVQRKTSKCRGHLTKESHVPHFPVTMSFSPACEGAPFVVAIKSLEAGRAASVGKPSKLSRVPLWKSFSIARSAFLPLPKIEDRG